MFNRPIRSAYTNVSAAPLAIGVLALLGATTPVAAQECKRTFVAEIGDAAQSMEDSLLQTLRKFQKSTTPIPREVADTAQENLPQLLKVRALDPHTRHDFANFDVYLGSEYRSSSPDVFVLPRDARVLCLLAPSTTVFLSDGHIHHYAMVRSVDYAARTVILVDPWASDSFLLAGRNLARVAGRPIIVAGEPQQLELRFDELVKVIHGTITGTGGYKYLAVLDDVFNDYRSQESYQFWKFSRLLAVDDGEPQAYAATLLRTSGDIVGKPSLQLLLEYANDILIRVASGFSIDAPGVPGKVSETKKRRKLFLQRLPAYAKALPWVLKWNLIKKAASFHDDGLTLAIIDSFLPETPNDVEFLTARGQVLLRQKQSEPAVKQFEEGERQWRSGLSELIDLKPPSRAVEFYFANKEALVEGFESFQVVEWSHIRNRLGYAAALLQRDRRTQVRNTLDPLLKYKGNLMTDFFPEQLTLMWIWGGPAEAQALVKSVLDHPEWLDESEGLQWYIGHALFEHLVTRQSVKDFVKQDPKFPRYEYIESILCTRVKNEPASDLFIYCPTCKLRDASERLTNDLKSFCAAGR
jgi:hypothetical protein